MRISSVHLENIKSHVDDSIDLTPGTNAIWGPNGSGKTTILEAIGFTLFDHLPYGQKAFVREGAPFGSIRIRFTALDDREYEVTRQIGKSRAHHVFDIGANQKIVEGSDHVVDWLRQHALGCGEGDEPKFLFENAIGVPQGMMTAAFRGTAAQRKSTFDRLLAVHEYESTWTKLLDTENLIRKQVGDSKERISRLDGEIVRLPSAESELGAARDRIAGAQADLKRFTVALLQVTEWLLALDRQAQERQDARHAANAAQLAFETAARELAHCSEAEARAIRAREAVVAAEPGYQQHLGAGEELKRLEPLREQRDEAGRLLATINGQLAVTESAKSEIEQELESARRASTAIEELAPEIASLRIAEEERDTAIEADKRRLELSAHLESQGARLATVTTELERLDQNIDRLRTLAMGLPDFAKLTKELDDLREQVVAARSAQTQLAQITIDRQILANESARLSALAAEADDKLAVLQQLRAVDDTIPQLEVAERDADTAQRHVAITLEFQTVAQQDLLRAQCPLLSITCPAAGDQTWVELRFAERMESLGSERTAAERAHGLAVTALADAKSAIADLPSLEELERERGRVTERLTELTSQFHMLDDKVAALQEAGARVDALMSEGRAFKSVYDKGRETEKEVASLPAQVEHRGTLVTQRDALMAEKGKLTAEIAPLALLAGQLKTLNDLVASKADARARHEAATKLMERMPDLESRLESTRSDLARLARESQSADAELARFGDVENRLRAVQLTQEANKSAYESYLGNRLEADTYDDQVAAVSKAKTNVTKAKADLEQAVERADALDRIHDVAAHEKAKADKEVLIGETAVLRGHIENDGKIVEERLEEIEALRQKVGAVADARHRGKELERTGRDVDFIRGVIRAAGPAVTESLVQSVTHQAAEIFGDVMDDHSMELRWEKDYDIVIRQGAEDRPFQQLSGGEQMSAALAVRLALIKQVSEIGVAFFDEPTQNMDAQRRANLAAQIQTAARTSGFQQLIVISHDDSFEEHTDHVVRLTKEHGRTVVL
ncbi:MAG TPA: SMC family ATPase [Chloroflexota bacterium]|nr:SMC family ATPase [Chloroflexota bacterium]